MENKRTKEFKADELDFENEVSAPIPGCFFIEMNPNVDTKSHSDALDNDFRKIHTPITEMIQIDVLSDMMDLEGDRNEAWLRQGTQIDSVFYQEKSERNEFLMRDKEKSKINEVMDYQNYLMETYNQSKEKLDDIVEEYPLVPSAIQYSLFVGMNENKGGFRLEKSNTTLFEKLITKESVYSSTKLLVEDKICVEIRDGVAFYSPISYLYRLYEQNN